MNPEDIMLSEVSKTQDDKYCVTPLTWGAWSSPPHRDQKWKVAARGGELARVATVR